MIDPFDESASRILFNQDTCELVSTKLFHLNGNDIEVFKYNYDLKNVQDEESWVGLQS